MCLAQTDKSSFPSFNGIYRGTTFYLLQKNGSFWRDLKTSQQQTKFALLLFQIDERSHSIPRCKKTNEIKPNKNIYNTCFSSTFIPR